MLPNKDIFSLFKCIVLYDVDNGKCVSFSLYSTILIV